MSRDELAEEILAGGIRAALQKHKITEDYLAKKLKAELNAKETKYFQFQGQVVEQRDVIAWDVRQRARMDAHKLLGHYPAEKHEHSGSVTLELSDRIREARERTGKK